MDRINQPNGGNQNLAGSDPDLLAALIATGGAPFPVNLSPRDREWLTHEVCRRRRNRLMRYIARAIANDIVRVLDEKE